MWELELILVYLFLCIWGGKRWLYVVIKFILYMVGGFIFILMGVLSMGFYGFN